MPEKSNDQGFAMTGSYTCMALTALLAFDSISIEEKSTIVKKSIKWVKVSFKEKVLSKNSRF